MESIRKIVRIPALPDARCGWPSAATRVGQVATMGAFMLLGAPVASAGTANPLPPSIQTERPAGAAVPAAPKRAERQDAEHRRMGRDPGASTTDRAILRPPKHATEDRMVHDRVASDAIAR